MTEELLDSFQKTLEDGLVKICSMAGLADRILPSDDMEERWNTLIKDYVADAVNNFNGYPNAALGFAAYLGMAVACQWDKDWQHYKDKPYRYYCGERGFDDMDDHIASHILHLSPEETQKISNCILNCTEATLGLLRHEGIETDTKDGFFILIRCYTAMYRIGASIELTRRGYRLEEIKVSGS